MFLGMKLGKSYREVLETMTFSEALEYSEYFEIEAQEKKKANEKAARRR